MNYKRTSMTIQTNVNEYSKKHNVSLSNIYQKIKRETLNSIKKDGKIYIIEEIEEKPKKENDNIKLLKKDIKKLKSDRKLLQLLLNSKDEEILTLKKTLSTFTNVFELQFKQIENNSIIVENEDKSKKKKKK